MATIKTNSVTGAVTISPPNGKALTLLPTFEAALEIEDELGVGVDQLRNRAVLGGVQAPALTTRELGVIVHAGAKAGGDPAMTRDAATRWAWEVGRQALRGPITEFLWSCADGGRGRAADLKNVASPNGSISEPNGESESAAIADEITAELTAAPTSDGS